MLYCHQALAHIDKSKFGSDATEFNPRRFVGNQALKKDVSALSVHKFLAAAFLLALPVLVCCFIAQAVSLGVLSSSQKRHVIFLAW